MKYLFKFVWWCFTKVVFFSLGWGLTYWLASALV